VVDTVRKGENDDDDDDNNNNNKPVNISVKHNPYFDIKPPDLRFTLARRHKTL
jgi:hypothetical protein